MLADRPDPTRLPTRRPHRPHRPHDRRGADDHPGTAAPAGSGLPPGHRAGPAIAEAAFDGERLLGLAKAGVLLGSLVSAVVAAVSLRQRDRFHDEMCLAEERDPA